MQNKSFIEQPEDLRKLAFIKAGDALKLIPQAVEKDWWVTAILEAVYALDYGSKIQFKGGTSLSKCWALLIAPTNEFVGFYPSASTEALMEYRDSPSRSMFCAAFSSLSW